MTVFEKFICVDCKIDTNEISEYYMLHDHIWFAHTIDFNGKGMLCIGCIERRLRRRLNHGDFTCAAINSGLFRMSERLKDRLYGQRTHSY
jgi:hypothetical protein